MINYVGQFITFLATLVAVKGGTWNKKERGIKKITSIGLISIILALAGLFTSSWVTYNSDQDSIVKSNQLAEAVKNTKEAFQYTKEANERAKSFESLLLLYKTILNEIREASERQPQLVMNREIHLKSHGKWSAPIRIYPGWKIKFYGFTSDLILKYGNVRLTIVASGDGVHPTETAVMGKNGIGMKWSVENTTNQISNGVIFVESTKSISGNIPGPSKFIEGRLLANSNKNIKSINWSVIDERIKRATTGASKNDSLKVIPNDLDSNKYASVDQQKMMETIAEWLETPYSYGSDGNERVTDDASFTREVFEQAADIILPRSAAKQAQVGKRVQRNELKFGDLVFFNSRGRSISHVGIYLGDDLFAHASLDSGVTISSLDSAYYNERYAIARRVLR